MPLVLTPSAEFLAALRRFEGLAKPGHPPALVAYADPISHGIPYTIAYGHTRNVKPGDTVTPEQAEALLVSDATAALVAVAHTWPWVGTIGQVRDEAMAHLAFNMGMPTLLTFNGFLGLMAAGRFTDAAVDLKGTRWYKQVNGDGRGDFVAAQIEKGAYS